MEKGLYRGEITGQVFDTIGKKDTPAFVVQFKPTVFLKRDEVAKTVVEVPVTEEVSREATIWLTAASREMAEQQIKVLVGDDWAKVAQDVGVLDPSYPGGVDLKGRKALFLNNGPKEGNSKYDDWSVFTPGQGRKRTSKPEVAQRVANFFAASAPPPKAASAADAADLYDNMPV